MPWPGRRSVGGVFEPDGKPHHVLAYACLGQLLAGHLPMGCAGQVYDQGSNVTDVGQVRSQLAGLNEPAPGVPPPFTPNDTMDPAPSGSSRLAISWSG